MNKGILYIVATPIGNMGDITYRAINTLKEVDIIACEDTRHTVKLLNYYDINKKLISFHEHSDAKRMQEILDILYEGKSIALVSDAGTPLISDPGANLVAKVADSGFSIVPIPGVSAVITALSACGVYEHGFVFYGFLPTKNSEKQQMLLDIKENVKTSVVYESPKRLLKTLDSMKEVLEEKRMICVAREMTKIHEEFVRGNISEVIGVYSEKVVKGEVVIIISGKKHDDIVVDDDRIIEVLRKYIENGCTKKDAVVKTASELSLNKNVVYKLSIKL